jgi:ADP-ribosyl-[dinitrogen reductase] hydrolase
VRDTAVSTETADPRSDKVAGGLLGLLVGDALGVPYEFTPPASIPPRAHIDMQPPPGFRRTYAHVPPGTWSDDGAQALCLLASLLERQQLDLADFAERLLRWHDAGYMAIDGEVFDVGRQTSAALQALRAGAPPHAAGPTDERANGNGSLMRVLPLALWHRGSEDELFALAMTQSLPTHGHLRSQLACGFYCLWARHLQKGTGDWDDAVRDAGKLANADERWNVEWGILLDELQRPATGTGYVADSLVSARAALTAGHDYASVVREAIALGNDTDTTAAIAGGLAGIRFGRHGIPRHWLDTLRGAELREPLLRALLESRSMPLHASATGPVPMSTSPTIAQR